MSQLKVLYISRDQNLFASDGRSQERLKQLGTLVEELHVIVSVPRSLGMKEIPIAPNITLYPTNSSSRWSSVGDIVSLGNKLVGEKKFVRGLSVIAAEDTFECGLAGLKIKSKWRLPLEVWLDIDPFAPYFSGFRNRLRKRKAARVIKAADSLRVVTQTLADDIVSRFGFERQRISVLPPIVDREGIEKDAVSFDLHTRYGRRFLMLAVASLTPQKNLTLALKVLALVNAKFPDTGLVIVGSGPEEKNLRSVAKRLGVEKAVAFEGNQEDVSSYYRTANVFLQTSHCEGYGLELVQAALSGIPILTTPVGIAREFEHGKDLYICPPGNPEYWAEVALDLLENNQKRELLKVNMKNAIDSKILTKDQYLEKVRKSWESVAQKVEVSH
jgi:glycosyltransferase involved in cell wall biosynthesis